MKKCGHKKHRKTNPYGTTSKKSFYCDCDEHTVITVNKKVVRNKAKREIKSEMETS